MREQRKSQRFELRLPVELVRSGTRRVSEVGETKNLSSGGVLFTSLTPMSIGDLIEYMITLPSGSSPGGPLRLRCLGKVLRTQPAVEDETAVAATLERYEFIREKA